MIQHSLSSGKEDAFYSNKWKSQDPGFTSVLPSYINDYDKKIYRNMETEEDREH